MKKKFLWGTAIALLSFTMACEEISEVKPGQTAEPVAPKTEQESVIQKYTILTGEHHATLTYEATELEHMKFKALFDSSAIYQTTDPVNQADINKLYGVSDCNSYHHTNSARFGWRWYEEKLEIWAYCYENGERKSAFVDTVSLNQFHEYKISFEKNKYVFQLNNKVVEMPRMCEDKALGYKLFPYFGGDEAAPKNISIWIEELQD
jgi:hypothetical protein